MPPCTGADFVNVPEFNWCEQDLKSEVSISKAQRRCKVGYVSIRHLKRATGITTYYSRTPSLHLKGDWLTEAGFGTDTPVTVAVERGLLSDR